VIRDTLENSTMQRRWWAAVALGPMLIAAIAAQQPSREQDKQEARARERVEEAQRQEGQAILSLADAAMAGKPVPSDFPIRWQNDFLKAQQGTFVPFTLTIDSSKLTSPSVMMYVRAAPHGATAPTRNDRPEKPEKKGRTDKRRVEVAPEAQYPVDAVFPVELSAGPGGMARIRRGFSVAPGEYDVYVIVRERLAGRPTGTQPRTTVLTQPLSVPNFWSNELTTSSVILADRLNVLSEPISADELVERPYVIGQNDITPATDLKFKKDEELIVVFLVYNPTVTPDKKFDIQVEYHFFRRIGHGTRADAPPAAAPHPPEREGERYFNHTDPQRFNPAIMGAQFDANGGHPVMAGQGIPLAGFELGEYRLAIRVTDLISGKSIMRDVNFTVGS